MRPRQLIAASALHGVSQLYRSCFIVPAGLDTAVGDSVPCIEFIGACCRAPSRGAPPSSSSGRASYKVQDRARRIVKSVLALVSGTTGSAPQFAGLGFCWSMGGIVRRYFTLSRVLGMTTRGASSAPAKRSERAIPLRDSSLRPAARDFARNDSVAVLKDLRKSRFLVASGSWE